MFFCCRYILGRGGLASRRVAFQGGVARAHAGSRCAAVYKVGLAYHGNAAETGEYLYDPSYTLESYAPTLDIGQVVHTLNRMFNLNVPPPCAQAF